MPRVYPWHGGMSVNMNKVTVRGIRNATAAGAAVTAVAILLAMILKTGNREFLTGGLLLTAALFAWGSLFLFLVERKLEAFSSELCGRLDQMMDGSVSPEGSFEEETLFSRINGRLERLYDVQQSDRRRVKAEKAELQTLVSDVSHQTKTTIANLKMLNDTLLTRQVPEESRLEFLRAAGGQLEKLDFFIQAMVKTSRLETGVITLEKKELPIIETLTAAINGVLALLEKKGLSFSVECPEELTLAHDGRWTSEAVFNLLDNAVKYTPAGGSIQIKVEKQEMYVKIDVADTGRGIPESEQASIFKRFYREENVHEVDGIGIGLYLAREIISMQGGYIRVSSQVGKGSVFSVYLPLR